MKKLLLFLAIVVFSHTSAFSQGCLPEGITLTTQSQVDDFPVNYPEYTVIEGDVEIWGWYDVTNLPGLCNITKIDGSHSILGIWTFPNLTKLKNLDTNGVIIIGGNAPGYSSQKEVVEACCTVGVPAGIVSEFSIYSNPTNNLINFEIPGTSAKSKRTILNLSGQEIM